MTDEDVARYRRLLDVHPEATIALVESLCWTVIQPLTKPVSVPEIARRLGADPDEIEHQTVWGDTPDWAVHLDQVGSAVVMVERFGSEGSRDEVLRWLSDGAIVHSSWWGINARGSFSYAAFGRLLTRLEDIDDDQPSGEQPTALDEDRAALRGLADDLLSSSAQLALVERRTGIRLDAAWLDEPHPMVVLRRPIPDDPRPPGIFAPEDPDLAALLFIAGEPAHRTAVRWVLGLLADEHGLRDEPVVGAILDALTHDWPTREAAWADIRVMQLRLQEEARTGATGFPERERLTRRFFAGLAFAETVGAPDGRLGRPATLYYAKQALGKRWPTIRAELWRRARSERGTA
ncbi:DUF6461 domain-containing protein [Micromonospora sp. NPDC048909]|uniref:DUF6461 domain-containing protein n=1 Tax=Micromonospora sp. NPDC048909 TaxID=3155643 RepID=UPI0033FD59F5